MAYSSTQPMPPVYLVHRDKEPISLQPLPLQPSSLSTDHSFKGRTSSLSEHVFRRRYILSVLATIVLVIMVMSVVFVAHAYFHQFGGQGFLKRDEVYIRNIQPPRLFLPLRKVEWKWNDRKDKEKSLLIYLPWNKRHAGSEIPYYTCGDQEESCETFGQPVGAHFPYSC
jgi:hypothetical protein